MQLEEEEHIQVSGGSAATTHEEEVKEDIQITTTYEDEEYQTNESALKRGMIGINSTDEEMLRRAINNISSPDHQSIQSVQVTSYKPLSNNDEGDVLMFHTYDQHSVVSGLQPYYHISSSEEDNSQYTHLMPV